MIYRFFKKLFCMHANWIWSSKASDWRTNERWAVCVICGKLKNVGYLGVLPICFTPWE